LSHDFPCILSQSRESYIGRRLTPGRIDKKHQNESVASSIRDAKTNGQMKPPQKATSSARDLIAS
jgi:hypothetical protein